MPTPTDLPETPVIPEIEEEAYVYRISPFPAATEAGRFWATWVKSTGRGRFFVLEAYQMSPESYRTVNGEWTFDRDRDDIRHDYDTAMRLAREAIPEITVNGYTIHDAVQRFAKKEL